MSHAHKATLALLVLATLAACSGNGNNTSGTSGTTGYVDAGSHCEQPDAGRNLSYGDLALSVLGTDARFKDDFPDGGLNPLHVIGTLYDTYDRCAEDDSIPPDGTWYSVKIDMLTKTLDHLPTGSFVIGPNDFKNDAGSVDIVVSYQIETVSFGHYTGGTAYDLQGSIDIDHIGANAELDGSFDGGLPLADGGFLSLSAKFHTESCTLCTNR